MTWFLIDMPAASLTDGGYHRLCRSFQKAFIDAGAPADLALFATREASEKRHLYLSPCSGLYMADLIHEYDGRPCDRPDAALVTLVYGVPGAVSLLDAGGGTSANGGKDDSMLSFRTSNETASAG